MKTTTIKAILLLLIVTTITSCLGTLTPQRQRQLATLAAYGNAALTIAQVAGAIDKNEAKLVRQTGKLILDTTAATTIEERVAIISNTAIDYVEHSGKMTPEQIEEMRKALVIDLTPPTLTQPATLVP